MALEMEDRGARRTSKLAVASSHLAPKNSVVSKSIKNGAIKMVDLNKKTKKSLKGTTWEITEIGTEGSVEPWQLKTIQASCPTGQQAISGGYEHVPVSVEVDLMDGVPNRPDGSSWMTQVYNDTAHTGAIRVWALCAPVTIK